MRTRQFDAKEMDRCCGDDGRLVPRALTRVALSPSDKVGSVCARAEHAVNQSSSARGAPKSSIGHSQSMVETDRPSCQDS
jgi:hypothetical protein